MSLLECDLHHEKTSGKLLGFYFTVIKDGVRYKRRLRLCEGCLNSLVAKYGSDWSDGFVLNRFETVRKCSSCRVEAGTATELRPMYVTAYSVRGNKYDYYATYCDECADVLIGTFELKAEDRHAA